MRIIIHDSEGQSDWSTFENTQLATDTYYLAELPNNNYA